MLREEILSTARRLTYDVYSGDNLLFRVAASGCNLHGVSFKSYPVLRCLSNVLVAEDSLHSRAASGLKLKGVSLDRNSLLSCTSNVLVERNSFDDA